MIKHLNITVTGKVQGVFFRAHTQEEAQKLGLKGFVSNEPNGNVFIEAEGEEDQLHKLVKWCYIGPPKAKVTEVKVAEAAIKHYTDFIIKR